MRNIFLIIALAFILAFTDCTGFQKNLPSSQPNTTWISEDGQITFWVDENGYVTGEMLIDDETIEIYVGKLMTPDIDIVHSESVIIGPSGNAVTEISFEHWAGDFYYNDHFTATVKRTTYFHVDDKISFYRVDDDVSTPDCALFQPTDSVYESINE